MKTITRVVTVTITATGVFDDIEKIKTKEESAETIKQILEETFRTTNMSVKIDKAEDFMSEVTEND